MSGALFSYVDIEARIVANHPLRAMRRLTNAALAELNPRFLALCEGIGRPSVPPERLLRATLLQLLYSIRSERQLIERRSSTCCFRWFVGLVDRREGVRRLDFLEEPRPLAHPRDRARVSVFAARPVGGEGASERSRPLQTRSTVRRTHMRGGSGQLDRLPARPGIGADNPAARDVRPVHVPDRGLAARVLK